MPSLGRNSLARFAADGAGLVFGLIASTITARWLGPSGKGTLSAFTFLGGLFMQLCCLGLGDAAIVLVGQRKVSSQEALSATVAAIGMSTLLGMVALWAVCSVQFRGDLPPLRLAILAACVGLPVTVGVNVLSHILNSQEQIVTTSAVLMVTSGLSALGTWLFLAAVPLSVLGGLLAGTMGSTVGLIVIGITLRRRGLSPRPRWNARYLSAALPYGASIQASYLLMVMSARVDLMLVYSLVGQAAAGQYSVALTLGTLVGLAPAALATASFPRLAHLEELEALSLTARLFRCGLTAATAAGALVLPALPITVPLLFGEAYRPAVLPSAILLGSGILWSGQWLLCRASAARGKPGLLFSSFGASLIVMCALDYLLIPRWGIVGAALAAATGPAIGLMICLVSYRRLQVDLLSRFLPTVSDLRFLATTPRRLLLLASDGGPAPSAARE
jgi:O-antigen/teichoic acid export membrane protein